MNRDEMFNTLATNTCRVEFTKVNGENRIMNCTRILDRIPMDQRPKGDEIVSEDTIRVFDTDAQGWRSFRISLVTKFEVS